MSFLDFKTEAKLERFHREVEEKRIQEHAIEPNRQI